VYPTIIFECFIIVAAMDDIELISSRKERSSTVNLPSEASAEKEPLIVRVLAFLSRVLWTRCKHPAVGSRLTVFAWVWMAVRSLSSLGFLWGVLRAASHGFLNARKTAIFGTIICIDAALTTYYGLYAAIRSLEPADLDHALDVRRSILDLVKVTAKRNIHFEANARYLCYLIVPLIMIAFAIVNLPLIFKVPFNGMDVGIHNMTLALGCISLMCNAAVTFLIILTFTCHVECVKWRVMKLTDAVEKEGSRRVVKEIHEYADIMKYLLPNIGRCWGPTVLVLSIAGVSFASIMLLFHGETMWQQFSMDAIIGDYQALSNYCQLFFHLTFPLLLFFVSSSLTTKCYYLVHATRLSLLNNDAEKEDLEALLGSEVGKVLSRLVILLVSSDDFGFCIFKGVKLSTQKASFFISITYAILIFAYTLSPKLDKDDCGISDRIMNDIAAYASRLSVNLTCPEADVVFRFYKNANVSASLDFCPG